MEAKVIERAGKKFLVFEIEMNKTPEPSGTGKTLVIATTHGNQVVPGFVIDGAPVFIGFNAYFKPRR